MINMKKITLAFSFLIIVSLGFLGPVSSQQRVVRPTMVIDFPSNGPNFQFFNKIDENDTQSRWRYSLLWNNIIEFSDTNQNGIFDSSSDTVVRNISIQNIDFTYTKVPMNLTGVNDEIVTGSEFIFLGNGTIDNTQFFVTIKIGWWNGVALHPYGSNYIKVNQNEAKFSIALENWTFNSLQDRLAIMTSIRTTTSLNSYDITKYQNGTLSMITKNNPDGKGKRGGIINNPNVTLIDSDSLKPLNMAVSNTTNELSIQYSVPFFNHTMLYDPTYSAVATVPIGSDQTTTSSKTSGVPGFDIISILLLVPTIWLVKKHKKRI